MGINCQPQLWLAGFWPKKTATLRETNSSQLEILMLGRWFFRPWKSPSFLGKKLSEKNPKPQVLEGDFGEGIPLPFHGVPSQKWRDVAWKLLSSLFLLWHVEHHLHVPCILHLSPLCHQCAEQANVTKKIEPQHKRKNFGNQMAKKTHGH